MLTTMVLPTRWVLLSPSFQANGRIRLQDQYGRRFDTDRENLQNAVDKCTPIFTPSGRRLTVADVERGRLS